MTILRYSAFTTPSGGGNAAGVVLDAATMSEPQMQVLAAELGYSETAFLVEQGEREYVIRYFSPEAEVDFCGHATVASSIALAEDGLGSGTLTLHTNVGEVPVEITTSDRGLVATLTSVLPETAQLEGLEDLLESIGWPANDLDEALPIGLAFAGLWHPILWARTRERLAALECDLERLKELCVRHNWGTVSLLYRETPELIHSRNAFPLGGVLEDAATGSAAAALGGFLRAHNLLPASGRFTVVQGEDMGQPCLLEVDASGDAGVKVSGTALPIAG